MHPVLTAPVEERPALLAAGRGTTTVHLVRGFQ